MRSHRGRVLVPAVVVTLVGCSSLTSSGSGSGSVEASTTAGSLVDAVSL